MTEAMDKEADLQQMLKKAQELLGEAEQVVKERRGEVDKIQSQLMQFLINIEKQKELELEKERELQQKKAEVNEKQKELELEKERELQQKKAEANEKQKELELEQEKELQQKKAEVNEKQAELELEQEKELQQKKAAESHEKVKKKWKMVGLKVRAGVALAKPVVTRREINNPETFMNLQFNKTIEKIDELDLEGQSITKKEEVRKWRKGGVAVGSTQGRECAW